MATSCPGSAGVVVVGKLGPLGLRGWFLFLHSRGRGGRHRAGLVGRRLARQRREPRVQRRAVLGVAAEIHMG